MATTTKWGSENYFDTVIAPWHGYRISRFENKSMEMKNF